MGIYADDISSGGTLAQLPVGNGKENERNNFWVCRLFDGAAGFGSRHIRIFIKRFMERYAEDTTEPTAACSLAFYAENIGIIGGMCVAVHFLTAVIQGQKKGM